MRLSATYFVYIGNHFLNLFFLRFEAKRAHGHLQFLRINGAGAIGIEEIECLANLLFLFLRELKLLP